MKKSIVEALVKEDTALSQSFYSECELNYDDLSIEVENIGYIKFPIAQDDIQKLLQISSEARFGLREKTLLDKKVRDTNEITADKVHVKCSGQVLQRIVSRMQNSLGLPENTVLIPHLHNMLIYTPGQFFKTHQDTEKLDGMVASMVIILPSPHIGGDLVIKHHKQSHRFVSENIDPKTLKLVAFYSDCNHEVERVKQGYRIALTYNLVLESKQSIPAKEHVNLNLQNALKNYFRIDRDKNSKPLKLAYFLDHSYTEHSLRWNMLKSTDNQNATAFKIAAEILGLRASLALVEIHETWSTEDDYYDSYSQYSSRKKSGKVELEELIDSNTKLTYWIDESNKKLPYGDCRISDDEICFSKDTNKFDPSDSEYEGYAGNYGNTMDFWYRRAAIVLWTKDDDIAMNFVLNYDRALEELLELTTQNNREKAVLDIIQKVETILFGYHPGAKKRNNFKIFLQIAFYISDMAVARSILLHFALVDINENVIEDLLKLQKLYGDGWFLSLLDSWIQESKQKGCSDELIKSNIIEFVDKWLNYGKEEQLTLLLKRHVESIVTYHKQYINQKSSVINSSVNLRVTTFSNYLRAFAKLQDNAPMDQFITYVVEHPLLYPILKLADITINLQKEFSGSHLASYKKLKDAIMANISGELSSGPREKDDWSISGKLQCNCEYCKEAMAFLRSKTEFHKVWPIVMQHREHIIEQFRGHELPIDISVEKKGSPHKLVIIKSSKIYMDAIERFKKLKICLQRLKNIDGNNYYRMMRAQKR